MGYFFDFNLMEEVLQGPPLVLGVEDTKMQELIDRYFLKYQSQLNAGEWDGHYEVLSWGPYNWTMRARWFMNLQLVGEEMHSIAVRLKALGNQMKEMFAQRR